MLLLNLILICYSSTQAVEQAVLNIQLNPPEEPIKDTLG
jgi:hypothetical protein